MIWISKCTKVHRNAITQCIPMWRNSELFSISPISFVKSYWGFRFAIYLYEKFFCPKQQVTLAVDGNNRCTLSNIIVHFVTVTSTLCSEIRSSCTQECRRPMATLVIYPISILCHQVDHQTFSFIVTKKLNFRGWQMLLLLRSYDGQWRSDSENEVAFLFTATQY